MALAMTPFFVYQRHKWRSYYAGLKPYCGGFLPDSALKGGVIIISAF